MSKSKEIIKRKIFDSVIFVLKYILKNSKSIPTEKQFRKNRLCHFSQKTKSQNKSGNGKIFRFRYFRFKIIPTDKTFSKNIIDSVTFTIWVILAKK